MSREIDRSKPDSWTPDEAQYLFDRYEITEEQLNEIKGTSSDQAPTESEMGEGDDPGDFTVGTVKAYLESDDTSDEEFARVIAAEKSGKARAGILGLAAD